MKDNIENIITGHTGILNHWMTGTVEVPSKLCVILGRRFAYHWVLIRYFSG